MNMNLFGYTYKIYNSDYNTEMINKQCNVGGGDNLVLIYFPTGDHGRFHGKVS